MHCPSLDMFGTFFPAWMLCAALGLGGAVAAHVVFRLVNIEVHVKPQLLAYPSIALTIAFLVWLNRYGS